MFLNALDDSQKLPFLSLADAVIHADEYLAPKETDLLGALKTELRVSEDAVTRPVAVEEAVHAFGERSSRVAVMLELLGLGYADGVLHAKESAVLAHVKEAFGIAPDEFEAMEDWVLRQMALTDEAAQFMAVK